MGLTEKLQALFSSHAVKLSAEQEQETKLATAKLDNGTEIETPAEGFVPGAEVFVTNDQGEQIALPDGSYTLEDGTAFNVEGGVIVEAEVEATEEEKPAEEMSEAKPEEKPVQLSREDVQAMINEAVLTLSKELVPVIESTQDTLQKLSAQPAAKVQRVQTEKVQLSRQELAAMPLADRINAMINQHTN